MSWRKPGAGMRIEFFENLLKKVLAGRDDRRHLTDEEILKAAEKGEPLPEDIDPISRAKVEVLREVTSHRALVGIPQVHVLVLKAFRGSLERLTSSFHLEPAPMPVTRGPRSESIYTGRLTDDISLMIGDTGSSVMVSLESLESHPISVEISLNGSMLQMASGVNRFDISLTEEGHYSLKVLGTDSPIVLAIDLKS